MKINFILSDTTKGATSECLKQVVRLAESDVFGSNIVIVPETKSIIIERELLSLSKSESFANVFVYSFVRLLDRLGGIAPEKLVNKQSAVMMLRKIIYDNSSKLKCYKKSAKTIGFAEKIYETIAQFKSSEISADELLLALSTSNSSLKSKLEDICFLYKKYEEALGTLLFDDLDKLAAISKLAEESKFVAESNIFIVGFDSVTQEMCTVLKNLARHAKSITFSAVYFDDKRDDKHIQDNHLYSRFKHIADELKYPYSPKFVATKKAGDFYAIQHYINSTKNYKFEPLGSVEVFEASSKKREADFVANKILEHISSGGRFRDVGVLLADTSTDLDILTECFETYQIPYFVNVATTIGDHFLSKFARLTLQTLKFNYSSEKLLELASNPLAGLSDFSGLYCFAREVGLEHEDFFKELKPENFACSKNYKPTLWEDLTKLREFLNGFKAEYDSAKTIGDFVRLMQKILQHFDVQSKLDVLSKLQRSAGLVVDAEISAQVLTKLVRFAEGMNNILGGIEVSGDEFLAIFGSGINLAKVNLAPISIDSVVIDDSTDGFFDIKKLFIFGAEEGKLPAKIQDCGIILDSELLQAKEFVGKAIDPSVKDTNKRENFKVYEAFLEPSEKLYVSYSTKSIGGQPQKRATAVNNLLALFDEKILTKFYQNADCFGGLVMEKRLARAINAYQNDKLSADELNVIYNQLSGNISEKFKEYLDGANVTKRDFCLSGAEKLYFFNSETSVSQLETYFDCPYKFFARYGLRLTENKVAKLGLPDIGTIVHRVVELFCKNISEYENISDAVFEQKVKELVRFAFSETKDSKNNRALLIMLEDECIKVAKNIIEEQQNSGFKITEKQEYKFSGDKALKLGDTGIVIHGKIDRIDEFGSYIRVIDYKTGQVSSDLKSVFFGKKIQLPVYLMVALASGKKVAGVFYFPIHSAYFEDEKGAQNAYKMTGFILDDVDVVKNMDFSVGQQNLRSKFVPLWVKFDKNGEMSFNGSQRGVYSDKEFRHIEDYTLKLCTKAVHEILDGNIEPSPVADSSGNELPASCKSCKLCGFCGLEFAKNKSGRSLNESVNISYFDLGGENE